MRKRRLVVWPERLRLRQARSASCWIRPPRMHSIRCQSLPRLPGKASNEAQEQAPGREQAGSHARSAQPEQPENRNHDPNNCHAAEYLFPIDTHWSLPNAQRHSRIVGTIVDRRGHVKIVDKRIVRFACNKHATHHANRCHRDREKISSTTRCYNTIMRVRLRPCRGLPRPGSITEGVATARRYDQSRPHHALSRRLDFRPQFRWIRSNRVSRLSLDAALPAQIVARLQAKPVRLGRDVRSTGRQVRQRSITRWL